MGNEVSAVPKQLLLLWKLMIKWKRKKKAYVNPTPENTDMDAHFRFTRDISTKQTQDTVEINSKPNLAN